MPVDKFGRMSDTKIRDTGVSLTYINNNYIRSDGGNLVSGSINMRGNTLYNMSDPVNPKDVATKEYVDKKTHIIAVHARYCGLLRNGEYLFKFGGNDNENCQKIIEGYLRREDFKGSTIGFIMPQSGYIKKIRFEMLGIVKFNKIIKKFDEDKVKEIKESLKFENIITEFKPFTDFLFSVVGFEKNLNKEDYPQPYYKPPKIISSILLKSCKGEAALFSIDKLRLGLISNCKIECNNKFSEGDVINIRTETDKRVEDFVAIPFSCIVTILIELDPL